MTKEFNEGFDQGYSTGWAESIDGALGRLRNVAFTWIGDKQAVDKREVEEVLKSLADENKEFEHQRSIGLTRSRICDDHWNGGCEHEACPTLAGLLAELEGKN
jgi:hypothetical protein